MLRVTYIFLFFAFAISWQAHANPITKGSKAKAPQVCGGYAGIVCGANQWCDFPEKIACGVADFQGVCKPKPVACTAQYQPVCGCDGDQPPIYIPSST